MASGHTREELGLLLPMACKGSAQHEYVLSSLHLPPTLNQITHTLKKVKRKSSSAVGLKVLIQLLSTKFPAVSVRCVNSTAFQERFCVATTAWEEIAVGPTEQYTKQHKNLPKILPPETKVLRPNMIHTLVWFLGQPMKDSPKVALSCKYTPLGMLSITPSYVLLKRVTNMLCITDWFQFLLPLLCIPIPDHVYDLVFTYLDCLYSRYLFFFFLFNALNTSFVSHVSSVFQKTCSIQT